MAQNTTVGFTVKVGTDEANQSIGSLKKQLKEAQAEVETLSDKFGATSQEAINAAKRAAELKDRIGDAKSLTAAFNPDFPHCRAQSDCLAIKVQKLKSSC